MTIETGWVDKLNRWALKSIGRSAVESVMTDNDGTTLVSRDGNQLIRWAEIKEIAAIKQPPLASGSFALVIRTGDSKMTVVDDTVTGYLKFCEELPKHLQGAIPFEKWAVELTAITVEPGQVIFRRSAD